MSRQDARDIALICGVLALLVALVAVALNLASQRWTIFDDRPAPVRWSGR